MRTILFILIFNISLFFSCINAPRNNKYDPDNPDKAEISGFVYEPDSLAINNVVVNLIDRNHNITLCDTSDNEGRFSFDNINPGIYTITAHTKYFNDIVVENESLWAGTKLLNHSIFFTTFHFEDDGINAIPYGFTTIGGSWKVNVETNGNHIYNGSNTTNDNTAISLFRNPTHGFQFALKIKISASSGSNWETGILLWYQDTLNYYSIKVTKSFIQYRFIKNGVDRILYTKFIEVAEDRWYYLNAIHYGDGLAVYLDNIFLFPISLITIEFSGGFWGLYVLNRDTGAIISVDFDDIYLKMTDWQEE